MNKQIYLVILLLLFCKWTTAQILCIYCYDQNAPVSNGVNNLVLNGGFENGCQGHFCPNSSMYSCDITNWTCTGGGINTYAGVYDTSFGSVVVEGNFAPYFGNYYCLACSPTPYDTSCLISIGCTVVGTPIGYPVNTYPGYGGSTGISLEQTINNLFIGNTYIVEFWAGGENSNTKQGIFALDVGFGDTLLREKPTPTPASIGTRYIIEFNATSTSHTIKFTNWGHICDYCTELIIDDVRLYTRAELDASVPHCTVGIDNPNFQNQENIFPNPITNQLNVKTNSSELSDIIIYDITSRKLLQEQFINSVSLNTEQLAKGIYLYEIRNKNGVIKKGKVVKE